MKRLLIAFFFVACGIYASAATWTAITSENPQPGTIRLISSSPDRSVAGFSLPGFYLDAVSTPRGQAYLVRAGETTPIEEVGAPDLPKMTASLIIPDQAGMGIRVIASEYTDYPDISIAPSKGIITRNIDPQTVPYTYGPAYSEDRFFPGDLAGTREPFIIRDVRGQTLIVYPFQYNPVTRTLRVYHTLTVELFKESEAGINPLPFTRNEKRDTREFIDLYRHQFLNPDAVTYVPLEEYGNLLVICYGPYMEAMQPYVNWKRACGYPTEIINRDSIGTTAAKIKAFIAEYYNTKGLANVLLVGDGPQIPTNTGTGLGGPSDNAYGYIVGNDHYSDVFVGRFSAENEAQVQTQVQRTLEYEQNPQFPDDDWFTTVIGIGSDQGPGDDNEYDYEHIRNQQSQLLDYTYTWNPELFDGSQGGNDAAGNPNSGKVTTEVNNGAGLILYTGHGSKTSWGTTGFSNTGVNQLSNKGKLPFIWSVACVNGDFTSGSACFAEAWLRATKDGEPTGAIAFLGSTINQSWNSPMEGQDEMTDILAESYPENIKRTFAGLSINGCMKMIQSYGTDGKNMADTWTVFGDPTVMVRTAVPQPMTVAHDTMLFNTDSVLAVYCSVAGARVTATLGNAILATALVVNDTALLTFPPLTGAPDTLRLVVTSYNMIPYIRDIAVREIPPTVVAGFTSTITRVVPGSTVAFADTSLGNTTYWQWHFPGGTPEYSTEQNPVVTYDALGVYDVKLVTGNGFSVDSVLSAGYIVVDFPAAAGERTAQVTCRISPNPSAGKFLLSITGPASELLGISIFNMVGTQVWTDKNIPGQTERSIDLSVLPEGVYFLKISGKETSLTKKIVISR